MIDNHLNTLVVIPAFNAAESLKQLLPRVREYVCEENLLVIDDGSTDPTPEVLETAGVNFIRFPTNRGKGAALRAAYQFALERGYRSVLSLDADLQHDPNCIPSFFARDTGTQIVLGRRSFNNSAMPPHRRLSNFVTSLILSVFSLAVRHDSQCGFRLVPLDLIRRLRLDTSSFDLESQLLFQAGVLRYPVIEVPIPTRYTDHGSAVHHAPDTLRFLRQLWRRIWY